MNHTLAIIEEKCQIDKDYIEWMELTGDWSRLAEWIESLMVDLNFRAHVKGCMTGRTSGCQPPTTLIEG